MTPPDGREVAPGRFKTMTEPGFSDTYQALWVASAEMVQSFAASAVELVKDNPDSAAIFATLAQAHATLALAMTAHEQLRLAQGARLSDLERQLKKGRNKKPS
jgi:hypothetical protein